MTKLPNLVDTIQEQLAILEAMDKVLFHVIVKGNGFTHVIKKNRRPIWRRGSRVTIGKAKELIHGEHRLVSDFKKQKRLIGLTEPLKPPYHALYIFTFGPEHSKNYHLSDLSNLFEIVSDSLQESGVIENDRWIFSFDGTRKRLGPETSLEVFVLQHPERDGELVLTQKKKAKTIKT